MKEDLEGAALGFKPPLHSMAVLCVKTFRGL